MLLSEIYIAETKRTAPAILFLSYHILTRRSTPDLIPFNFLRRRFLKLPLSDLQFVHSFIHRCCLIIRIDHFLKLFFHIFNSFLFHVIQIREDFRLDYAFFFANQNFLYKAGLTDLILQFFRRHILSVFRNDQILLPPGQIDKAVFVYISQISGS